MKKTLKFTLCFIACTLIFSLASKAQGGSANTKRVIDSLKITDADEIAICNLYDDAVTECLNVLKAYSTNGTKPTAAQQAEVNKRFQEKQKEIQPQIESFRRKIAANYAQLMNFVYFCNYENMRIYGGMLPMNGMSPYSKAPYPGYPTPPASH